MAARITAQKLGKFAILRVYSVYPYVVYGFHCDSGARGIKNPCRAHPQDRDLGDERLHLGVQSQESGSAAKDPGGEISVSPVADDRDDHGARVLFGNPDGARYGAAGRNAAEDALFLSERPHG